MWTEKSAEWQRSSCFQVLMPEPWARQKALEEDNKIKSALASVMVDNRAYMTQRTPPCPTLVASWLWE